MGLYGLPSSSAISSFLLSFLLSIVWIRWLTLIYSAEAARAWASLSVKWYTYEVGAGSPQLTEMEATAADPTKHKAWGSREPAKVRGPDGLRQ